MSGSSRISRTPTAPRCLPSCKLRGTTPCPEPFPGDLSLPKGFDDDEGRRLHVRHISEAARKAICASVLHNFRCSLQHVLVGADRDANHRHPSFVCNVDINAFPGAKSPRPSGLALSVVVPRSWRGWPRCPCRLQLLALEKVLILIVLAVTPI